MCPSNAGDTPHRLLRLSRKDGANLICVRAAGVPESLGRSSPSPASCLRRGGDPGRNAETPYPCQYPLSSTLECSFSPSGWGQSNRRLPPRLERALFVLVDSPSCFISESASSNTDDMDALQ